MGIVLVIVFESTNGYDGEVAAYSFTFYITALNKGRYHVHMEMWNILNWQAPFVDILSNSRNTAAFLVSDGRVSTFIPGPHVNHVKR